MPEKANNAASTGYTAFQLWKETRNALIKKSVRWNVGATLIPSVALRFAPRPHARFETVRVGTLNRHKSGKELVNNVTIGRLVVDSAFKLLPVVKDDAVPAPILVQRTVEAMAWYMIAQQDGHMSRNAINDLANSVLLKLDPDRVVATSVDTLSDLADPKAVSKAYNAFFRI